LAPIGAPGIKDAKSAKKWKKSGNSSYLFFILPLKASFVDVTAFRWSQSMRKSNFVDIFEFTAEV